MGKINNDQRYRVVDREDSNDELVLVRSCIVQLVDGSKIGLVGLR